MMCASSQQSKHEAIEVAREARGPDIMSISHIHVLLLSSAISIVSRASPSLPPVLVLKLPISGDARNSSLPRVIKIQISPAASARNITSHSRENLAFHSLFI